MATEYGNRGRMLERAIDRLFESYRSRGIHCQHNHPEQLHDGTLVRKHGFDFQIYYRGSFLAFDAKMCAGKSWPLSNAKPHQLKALLDVVANGGEAFFLVYFSQAKRLVRYSAVAVKMYLADGIKSVSPDVGTETKIDLLGIKKDD